jgi:hypothetical protein
MTAAPAKPPRWPLVLLGFMTLFSFGGPVLIGVVLAGGPRPNWPPDRPVEWATFVLVSAGVVGLMTGCVGVGLANHRALLKSQAGRTRGEPRPGAES